MLKQYSQLFVIALVLTFVVSCGGQSSQEEQSISQSSEASAQSEETVTARPTALVLTATPLPPTEEATDAAVSDDATSESTATPSPTATIFPTATAVPAEWLTPAAHAPDVQQPPYVVSECSDRFPCNEDVEAWEERIRVPEGFEASYFAYLPNPEHLDRALQLTSLTFGPDGLLYVATTRGDIYAIDQNGKATLFADGLIVPTGLAFQPGTEKLYISNRVLDLNIDGEGQVSVIENGVISTLFDGLPCCYVGMHGPNGIAFGPDGYGYVGVGGRADHGEILDGSNMPDEMQPLEATILRFNPDGSEVEPYAYGFRNPYDISWDADGRLFATDNGRDGEVADELHIVEPGAQHGYPYFDCPAWASLMM